jgi:hypothetical protein
MSGVLPANVSFFMQRLAGVSTSHFKIQPQGSDSATSNKIVRFELPSNTLVNMKNIRLMFNADANGTATAGGRLPNKIDSLISRVAVYMGGVLVQNNFNNYNVLRHAKDAIEGDKCPALHGHPEIVRATSYHDSSTYTTNANEAYAGKDDMFCVDYWEGLLGSIEPSIIDTGLLPQITLELTLAEDAVCPSVHGVLFAVGDGTGATNTIDKAGGTACTYNLTNMSLQVEVLGMATSVLDQLVEARISQVGYLSLPFKNYYTFSSTHSGTSRFSVNSASWDRAWFVYRPTGAGTQPASFSATPAGAHPVPGYKLRNGLVVETTKKALVNNGSGISASTTVAIDNFSGGTIAVGDFIQIPQGTAGVATTSVAGLASAGDSATNTITTADAITCADNSPIVFLKEVGTPVFDSGGVLDTNKEKYVSKFFRMKEPLASLSTPATYQLQVNGASLPAYKCNRNEMYEITKGSVDGMRVDHNLTLAQYIDSYFVQCMRFCLPDSGFSRLASGLDTRSVSAQAALETSGLDNCHLDIFAETTAELRVGSGRSIEIIA